MSSSSPMAGRHVDAVCAIDSRCFSRPWSAAQWRTELTAADRTHLVARDSDQVVAHAGTLRVLDDFTSRPLPSTPTMKARATAPASVSSCCASAIATGATGDPRVRPRRTAPSSSMAASGCACRNSEPLLRPSHRRRRHHVAPRSRLAGDRRAARSGRRRTPPISDGAAS